MNRKAGIRAHRGPIGRTNKRFGVKLRGAQNILVFGPKRRPVRRIRGSTRPIVAPGRPGVLLSMYSVIKRIVYAQLAPIPKYNVKFAYLRPCRRSRAPRPPRGGGLRRPLAQWERQWHRLPPKRRLCRGSLSHGPRARVRARTSACPHGAAAPQTPPSGRARACQPCVPRRAHPRRQ